MVAELLFVVILMVVLEVVFVLLTAALGSICDTAAVTDGVDAVAGAEDVFE